MTLASLCVIFLATIPTSDLPAPTDVKQAYQEAKSKAGRSAEDQVRLALWCEAQGLTTERLHHLSLAVLADPKNATARGLMGMVLHDGRWVRPEILEAKLKADADHAAILAEYESKRLKSAYTADAQWALGLWADDHDLKEQAKAHLTAVIRLEPSRENAWKRLGFKKHDGRWTTDAQLTAAKAEAEAQKTADKIWRPLLDRYKSMLDRPMSREGAEASLAEVTDPRAVPAIMLTFGKGREADQLRAVQLLGQVDSPSASRSLAGLAVLSKSAEVRRASVETLKRRDPRDFVRLWIALIRKPAEFEVKPVKGPGSSGSLVIKGEKADLKRLYSAPTMPSLPSLSVGSVSYDANGLPVLHVPVGNVSGAVLTETEFRQLKDGQGQEMRKSLNAVESSTGKSASPADQQKIMQAIERSPLNPLNNVANVGRQDPQATVSYTPIYSQELQIPIGEMVRETQVAAIVAQQQLISDIAALEKANVEIRRANEPILMALKSVTGGDLGDDGAAWTKWWTDLLGYAMTASSSATNPTFFENVPIGYTPSITPSFVTGSLVVFERTQHHSCFAAGTTVRTIDGDRAIESIRAGDLVLVQDTTTGGLKYQAVVAAYHNPPSPTLKVGLGEDSVVATGIHRFWKTGKGWTMARELKAGDVVRTLGGVAKVESVVDDRIQPVFNLEVADGHSFLVGKLGILVHDNSLVEATPNPFDSGTLAVAKDSK